METRLRAALRRLLVLAMVIGLLLIANYATVSSAAAGHETRVVDIQESGLDVWIMALVIAGVVVVLVAFATIVLMWEHRDEEAERRAASAPARRREG
ncbi:MAG: hypothetical protein ACE5FA_07050 [Dehalococcoidia bacterium]